MRPVPALAAVLLPLAFALAAGAQEKAPPPRARPRAAPRLFAGNATCRACPLPPCTRPCLDALPSEGPAAPRPYSRGICPVLTPGRNRDVGHTHRSLLLGVPTTTRGPYGVLFFWPAAGPAESIWPIFGRSLDAGGYILVIPDADTRFPLSWSMDARGADDDLRFFDDVLACLDAQYPIDRRRIHSAGYSTGAVFSAYLMGHRHDTLASFVSFSGGGHLPSGEMHVPLPTRKAPALLYHGGATDTLWAGREATLGLAARMRANGQPTLVCDHGRGHVVGASAREMWSFLLAHPFRNDAVAAGVPGPARARPAYCTEP